MDFNNLIQTTLIPNMKKEETKKTSPKNNAMTM